MIQATVPRTVRLPHRDASEDEGAQMAKVSRTTAENVKDFGVTTEHTLPFGFRCFRDFIHPIGVGMFNIGRMNRF